MPGLSPLFIVGGPEMLIILAILILLFGASRIPKVARATGQAIGEFKKARSDVDEELEEVESATSVEAEPESGP